MLKASFIPYQLVFKQAAGTSRGVLHEKPSWFIVMHDVSSPDVVGIGECSIIPGLSIDPINTIEQELSRLCEGINQWDAWFDQAAARFPSIAFGLETALIDLQTGGKQMLFDNAFTSGNQGIPINGLVWMGSKDFMRNQIKEKIDAGFSVIKLKVGAIDFNQELELIRLIRDEFDANTITIRLDANGAFSEEDVFKKIIQLSKYQIHSIEQPVKPGQYELMYNVCRNGFIPIALDEELIGISNLESKQSLLDQVKPAYIILKPSLLGGFKQSEEWIRLAESFDIGWWATSALESNVGLNAIAQWTATFNNLLPQGLGTGLLYHNNIASPLEIKNATLWRNLNSGWNLSAIGC